MNKIVPIILLSSIALFFFWSCNSTASSKKKGALYYYAHFDEQNRMYINDGSDILLTYQLSYHQGPKDAHDGDHGKNLHISFSNWGLFKEGKTYQLPHPEIKTVVSEWASPAGFLLNRAIKGSITIHKIKEYQSIHMDLNLQLQTGIQQYDNYQLSNNQFVCNKFHQRYAKNDMELEKTDGSYTKGSLSSSDFEGQWLQKGEIFHNKNQGWRSYFYIAKPLEWEIKSGKLVQMNDQQIKINQGRLLFKDKGGIDQFYAINHFSSDSLVITNLNARAHNRYIFVKK